VVERKYLPEDRADGCEEEYEQVAFAPDADQPAYR
jgi:hypothetical protein